MAITERYVRADAAGGGDGTTDAASGANGAFTWAEMITDINTPRVGYRYNVKQGTYTLAATSTFTGDGNTTSPNIIRGFKTTIGDATLGRSSGGALDASNMPTIAYNSGFRFDASGSTSLIVEALSITGTVANSLLSIADLSAAYNNIVVNSSNSASARAIENAGQSSRVWNNDASLPSGVASARVISATGSAVGNRVTGNNAAVGIYVGNNGGKVIALNTVYNCGPGITKNTTGAEFECGFNTIVNCSGDGIDVVTSSTAQCNIYCNHITGCSGWAIDFNTSTCQKYLFNNRFRDNSSGEINGGGDYQTSSNWLNITSDDTDALDFTNQGSNDYSLKAGAAATSKAIGYLMDIGANGSPVVSSSGGAIGGGNLSGGFQ
jgi:hypothetical protein